MQSPFWFSWRELSLLARFFLLVLAFTSIYVVISAWIVLRRVRSLMSRQAEDVSTRRRSTLALQARCANMGQLLASTFYFFGVLFFFLLWEPTWLVANKIQAGTLMAEIFLHDFAYAADVFFAFFVLSLIQWFASARVRASSLRLDVRL